MRSIVLAGTCAALAVTFSATACSSSGLPTHRTSGASGAAAAGPTLASHKYSDWTTYGGGTYRQNNATTMPSSPGRPSIYKKLHLDGAVYASPLIIRGITLVATENDTVYAFSPTFRQLWKRHLGSPSPAGQRPCGNIDPLGITGTPVYSPATKSVYVAAEFSGNPPTHTLFALSFASGKVRWKHHLDFAGVDQRVMQERGALLVSGSRVYVPFGGLAGDCGQYKGRIISYPVNGSYAPQSYTVPTAREAGIWTSPGPSADAAGHLFAAVGNGASGGNGAAYDHSDSILELNRSLKLTDSFSPASWRSDNDNDYDLGSQGPAIVGKWIFTEGKSGFGYVLRRAKLGGIGGQVSTKAICNRKSYGGTAVHGGTVYVPCEDGVRAVQISSSGRMTVLWRARSSYTGTPLLGGGRLWTLDTANGVLHALNPANGVSHSSTTVGAVSRFAAIAVYGRTMVVPTLSGITVVHANA